MGYKWGPSIDHILALADGGNSDFDNLQLMHAYCNSKKSSDHHLDRAQREREAARELRQARHQERMREQAREAAQKRKSMSPKARARHSLYVRIYESMQRRLATRPTQLELFNVSETLDIVYPQEDSSR